MASKCCNICNQEKSIDDFYKSMAKCKICYGNQLKIKRRERYTNSSSDETKYCLRCKIDKHITDFQFGRNVCTPCSTMTYNEIRAKAKEDHVLSAGNITKKCIKCKEVKSGLMFSYGRRKCKKCVSDEGLECNNRPSETNPPKECNTCKITKNATSFRYQNNVCRECEKQRLYKWRLDNPEKFAEICKRYRDKPDYSYKQALYKRNRYNTDILYKTQKLYRNRLRAAIHGTIPREDYLKLLGCTYEHLMEWLEYNFHSGMTWDNMGSDWHVDHIIPCASFDLSKPEQLKECFQWSNLAPALVRDNLTKSNKIIPELIEFFQNRAIEFSNLYQDVLRGQSVMTGAITTKGHVEACPGSGERPEVWSKRDGLGNPQPSSPPSHTAEEGEGSETKRGSVSDDGLASLRELKI